jgi:dephospho-CoA kinase
MLIGITGKIGSGKSVICDEFKNAGFIEDNFSSSLKQIGEIIGFEHHQLYGTQEQKLEINNKWNISGREFMQKFGTELCRNQLKQTIPNMKFDNNNSIWVQIIQNKLYNEYKNKNIIIGDCRFLDEVKLIKDNGGIIIKIIRSSNTEDNNFISINTDNINNEKIHSSETTLDNILPDIIINNNKDLLSYRNKIKHVIKNINELYKHNELFNI